MISAAVRGCLEGEWVTTKLFPNRLMKITKVFIPADGPPVYTLDARVWVGADQIIRAQPVECCESAAGELRTSTH